MSVLKSKAVLFGLNYNHIPESKLNGCVNDVKNMAAYLKNELKVPVVECYTDDVDRITTGAMGMLNKLYQTAIESYQQDLDFVWIHYSGHGCGVCDTSGDEADGMDECLVPSDYNTVGIIPDDYIEQIMRYFNPKTRVIMVWDCCHSATMGDLKYSWESATSVAVENIMCAVQSKIITLSGCLDNQTSADAYINGQWAGALTASLLSTLKNNPGTLKDVFQLLPLLRSRLAASGYTQVPKLCSTYNLAFDKVLIPF